MASNYTTNYQLNQWEAGDQVLRTEFNQDNLKIDTALKNHDDEIAGLEAAVVLKGNCQIHYDTFVGTGSGATQFTFSRQPLCIFLVGITEWFSTTLVRGTQTASTYKGNQYAILDVTWNGNSVSISQPQGYQDFQFNQSGKTYALIALLAQEE